MLIVAIYCSNYLFIKTLIKNLTRLYLEHV